MKGSSPQKQARRTLHDIRQLYYRNASYTYVPVLSNYLLNRNAFGQFTLVIDITPTADGDIDRP